MMRKVIYRDYIFLLVVIYSINAMSDKTLVVWRLNYCCLTTGGCPPRSIVGVFQVYIASTSTQ